MTNAANTVSSANAGPTQVAASHHTPPAGRQHRPRRKSLEQLEAKYKALMRNMLMYQQMRKQNTRAGHGAGNSLKTESGLAGGRLDPKSEKHLGHHQGKHTLPTPSPSVSPPSYTINAEDPGLSQDSQHQQQHILHQSHQNSAPSLHEQQQHQQRERQPQKRLQNSSNGPKSAYDRREGGSGARNTRPGARSMTAAVHLAYEELASRQQQHQQQTHLAQQHQQQQNRMQEQQQQPPHHQASAPIPIPRRENMQIPPHYLHHQQQQYMHHPVPPHAQTHHPPLAPHHLHPAPYAAHHNLPALSPPYGTFEPSTRTDHELRHGQQHQQQQQQQPQPPHVLQSFDQNGNIEDDLVLDCFGSNMADI